MMKSMSFVKNCNMPMGGKVSSIAMMLLRERFGVMLLN